jgi:hypothetical protein
MRKFELAGLLALGLLTLSFLSGIAYWIILLG